MPQKVRIAVDAMGGDHGPTVVIPGAQIALERHPDTEFLLFGDSGAVEAQLGSRPKLAAASKVVHTDVAIRMDVKPSVALRQGRWKSSMWRAIEAVKHGEADVAVSAGNTGALMAMAKFQLRTLPGIDRPGIAALWPTLKGEAIVLDLGASIGADAQHLVELAIMGGAMARVLFDLERPTIGLLNIGVEEAKGLEEVREAGRLLRELALSEIEYIGFVEGDDIGKGTADVTVTEGFTGNIALKTAEGTARQMGEYLRNAMRRTWMSRIGYLLARNAFQAVRDKMDARRFNGGVLLGLNGVVIKSHGGTDDIGFAFALDMAYDMARYDLMARITEMLRKQPRNDNRQLRVGGAVL